MIDYLIADFSSIPGRTDAVLFKNVQLDRNFDDDWGFLHLQGYFYYFHCVYYINGDLIYKWLHLHLNRNFE